MEAISTVLRHAREVSMSIKLSGVSSLAILSVRQRRQQRKERHRTKSCGYRDETA
jgi:hypothetical protein